MTVQLADKIEYRGGNYPCIVGSMPKEHALIEKFSDPKPVSINCLRGFYAQWSVIDENLYLSSVEGNFKKLTDKPIFADWFSGFVTIGVGEVMSLGNLFKDCRAEDSYESYETEVIMNIRNGIVEKSIEIDGKAKLESFKRSLSKTNLKLDKLKTGLKDEGENELFLPSRAERIKVFLDSND